MGVKVNGTTESLLKKISARDRPHRLPLKAQSSKVGGRWSESLQNFLKLKGLGKGAKTLEIIFLVVFLDLKPLKTINTVF